MPVTISVLVPTYRRPRDLERCLSALARQSLIADEVIVVSRDGDQETRGVLAGATAAALPVKPVTVSAPGVVAAMNAGLAASTGEIIAVVDDDAAPRADWLLRLAGTLETDISIAGAGGRDIIHDAGGNPPEGPLQAQVGRLQWHGRSIGNHHCGMGGAREVDFLKGVNCAYRADILKRCRFDTRLRGQGAQVHWELSLGLAITRAGWKLIYDPAILVDHYPAPRFDADTRGVFNAGALSDAAYNETLILMEHLPPLRRAAYRLWSEAIGSRGSPGFLQWVRLCLGRDALANAKWRAAACGRADARRAGRSMRRAPALSQTLEAH